jgi:hypothetical protein
MKFLQSFSENINISLVCWNKEIPPVRFKDQGNYLADF